MKKFLSMLILVNVVYAFKMPTVIKMRNGLKFDPLKGEPKLALKADWDYGYYIVQFKTPIKEEYKNAIKQLGGVIEDYVYYSGFIVRMSPEKISELKKMDFVRWVGIYHPEYKIMPDIGKPKNADWRKWWNPDGKLKLSIIGFKDCDVSKLVSSLSQLGCEILEVEDELDFMKIVVVKADETLIGEIAKIPEVWWIEEKRPIFLHNIFATWIVQSNQYNVHSIWQHGITGENVVINVIDTGADTSLCFLNNGKVTNYISLVSGGTCDCPYNAWTGDGHGSHTSTSAAGNANEDPDSSVYAKYNGVAYNAKLVIMDAQSESQCGIGAGLYIPSNLYSYLQMAYSFYNARVFSNSWGSSTNSYTSFAHQVDEFMHDYNEAIVLFSAGNDGPGSGTITAPATAKNIVSVGATRNYAQQENLAYFSSQGPTYDGRLKPEVVAPGYSVTSGKSDGNCSGYNCGTASMAGTSMSCPIVAGASALVIQYYKDIKNHTPSGALIKATLVASGKDITGNYATAPIPNNAEGWGRVLLDSVLEFEDDPETLVFWDNITFTGSGSSVEYQVNLSSVSRLRIVLAWSDYPGSYLVNDLNLMVISPSGDTFWGNYFSGGHSISGGSPDTLNPLEAVYLNSPEDGLWKIIIKGYNIPYPPQKAALLLSAYGNVVNVEEKFSRNVFVGKSIKVLMKRNGFKLVFVNPKDGFVEVKLYDISGRIIKSLQWKNLSAGYKELNFDNLKTGVYFVEIKTARGVLRGKAVVLR